MTKEFVAFTRLDASDVNSYLVNRPLQNAIINGAFDIWQRGTSATLAVGFLGADRWQHSFATAVQTGTSSRQSFSPGELDSLGISSNDFYQRIVCTNNNGSTEHAFTQRIENVTTFANQTVTMSFYAKAASATTLRTRLVQLFGSGGSTAVTTSFVDHSLTTSWQRFTVQVSVPSVTGKTIGANSSLRWDFGLPLSTYTIDIWGVQLEAGTVATPFRRNANSIQGELAACQRYYWRVDGVSNWRIGSGITLSTTTAGIIVQHPVLMRAKVSAIDFSTLGLSSGQISVNDINSLYTTTALTISSVESGPLSTTLLTTNSGLTANRPIFLGGNGGSPFLGFSAEL